MATVSRLKLTIHSSIRVSGIHNCARLPGPVVKCRQGAVSGFPTRRVRFLVKAAESSSGGGDAAGGGSSKGNGGKGGNGGNGGKKKRNPSEGAPHPLRPWTFIYAAFLTVGGIMGYVQASSHKSLFAGLSASVIMVVCAIQMGGGPATSSAAIVAAVVSAALAGVMGVRYSKTNKFMPSGLTAALSGALVFGFLINGF